MNTLNTLNSKTNEFNRFVYQFADKLNNKNMALANLSIYYTWKKIKCEYNNDKLKISAPTSNDEFDLCCPMDLILFLIYTIILSTSLQNMKLLQIIPLFKFMGIK